MKVRVELDMRHSELRFEISDYAAGMDEDEVAYRELENFLSWASKDQSDYFLDERDSSLHAGRQTRKLIFRTRQQTSAQDTAIYVLLGAFQTSQQRMQVNIQARFYNLYKSIEKASWDNTAEAIRKEYIDLLTNEYMTEVGKLVPDHFGPFLKHQDVKNVLMQNIISQPGKNFYEIQFMSYERVKNELAPILENAEEEQKKMSMTSRKTNSLPSCARLQPAFFSGARSLTEEEIQAELVNRRLKEDSDARNRDTQKKCT